jgi:hypothetical protein
MTMMSRTEQRILECMCELTEMTNAAGSGGKSSLLSLTSALTACPIWQGRRARQSHSQK